MDFGRSEAAEGLSAAFRTNTEIEGVLAYVALREGHAVSAEELVLFSRQHLAKYKCPERVVFLPGLPKGITGKVHWCAIKELRAEAAVTCTAAPHGCRPKNDQPRYERLSVVCALTHRRFARYTSKWIAGDKPAPASTDSDGKSTRSNRELSYVSRPEGEPLPRKRNFR